MLGTRQVPDWLEGFVQDYPTRELIRIAAYRLGFSDIACDGIWEWAEVGFAKWLAKTWGGRIPCLYGCENCSMEAFRVQKSSGCLNILFKVIAHHSYLDQIIREEIERFPAATTQYLRHLVYNSERLNIRKDEEIDLADLIIVNSSFVRHSFEEAGASVKRVVTVSTPCPPVVHRAPNNSRADQQRSMVFLSAGTQSLRKGTHILLEAWGRLQIRSGHQLWLIGKLELPRRLIEDLPAQVSLRPAMNKSDLINTIFPKTSVFVLPTLCEGRAQAVLDAVAFGLPVITTYNSGCQDIVEHGVNGWIIPIRDTESLASQMQWCIDHMDEVNWAGARSLEKAGQWQFSDYDAMHINVIESFLSNHGIP